MNKRSKGIRIHRLDRIYIILMIVSIVMMVIGSVWSAIATYAAGCDHALSYGEQFQAAKPSMAVLIPGLILFAFVTIKPIKIRH